MFTSVNPLASHYKDYFAIKKEEDGINIDVLH
jgi:hypothetical protein